MKANGPDDCDETEEMESCKDCDSDYSSSLRDSADEEPSVEEVYQALHDEDGIGL